MKKIKLKEKDLLTFYVYTLKKDLKNYIKIIDRKTLKTIKNFDECELIFESYNCFEGVYLFLNTNIKKLDIQNLNPYEHGFYNNVFFVNEVDIIITKDILRSENDYYIRTLKELQNFLKEPYKFYFDENTQKVYKEGEVEIIWEDEIPF